MSFFTTKGTRKQSSKQNLFCTTKDTKITKFFFVLLSFSSCPRQSLLHCSTYLRPCWRSWCKKNLGKNSLAKFLLLSIVIQFASFTLNAAEQVKEKTWWEKRRERPDIFYPHDIHKEVMEKKGDSCMLCHSFMGNKESDSKRVKPLTAIANEPLKAICHDCHVVKLEAPWRCDVCHSDPKSVWPESHNFGYVKGHSEDARHDEHACRECHIDVSYCTDCHFRRDPAQRRVHGLGYRISHGIEARMDPAWCGTCHSGPYCEDCHRGRR